MTTKISIDNIQLATLTALATVPKVTSISYPGNDTAADPAGGQTITLTGGGFAAGATVIVNGAVVSPVTVANAASISFTAPAQSAGTYALYVLNSDGGTAILYPGISYSGTPTWSNAAGSIGTFTELTTVNRQLVATGDAPVSYSLYSGSLPTGVTLDSNGILTGSTPLDAGSTTYSFVIRATDAQNQDTDRAFSLTVTADTVNWAVPPSDGYTYTLTQLSPMSNVIISGTSNTGNPVSFTANGLPAGLSIANGVIYGTPTVAESNISIITGNIATLYRTSTRTINWVINIGSDIYWKLTTLSLSASTSLTTSSFINDNSSSNFQFIVAGDTRAQNFNPYAQGYYSNYFNGSTDYLTLPTGTGLQLGSLDFTFEGWMYLNDTTDRTFVYWNGDTGGEAAVHVRTISGKWALWISKTGTSWEVQQSTLGTAGAGNWYHVAVVRNSTNIRLYINGADVTGGGYTVTGSLMTTYTLNQIGTYNNGYYFMNGYISNIRLTLNQALYTANFIPSTAPLTAISGTNLLTCQSNRLIDNSSGNLNITRNGTPTVSSANPFGNTAPVSVTVPSTTNYSTYFDGTGDYLTATYAINWSTYGSFTLEFWVYFPTIAAVNMTFASTGSTGYTNFYMYGSSGTYPGAIAVGIQGTNEIRSANSILAANQWYHVAYIYNGLTTTIYVNGASVASGTTAVYSNNSANLVIGNGLTNNYLSGYISNFRIVRGLAVYLTAFTPSITPLTANTTVTSAQSNSVSFDGTGDYLTAPTGTAFNFSTSNFTVEGWIYTTTLATEQSVFDTLPIGGLSTRVNAFVLVVNATTGTMRFYTNSAYSSSTSNAVSINTWTHFAIVKSSGVINIYINGVLGLSVANTSDFSTGGCVIGRYGDAANGYYNGYISNLRVTKGQALYTANFTPATSSLSTTSQGATAANVSLLACQSTILVDNSTNQYVITAFGDAKPVSVNPFVSINGIGGVSYSGYFNGSSQYLTVPSSTALDLSTGTPNFTIEAWIYWNGSNANGQIIEKDGVYAASYVSYGLEINGSGYARGYLGSGNGTSSIQSFTSSTTLIARIWTHLAFVRNSTVATLYQNGVNVASATITATMTDGGKALFIGFQSGQGASQYFDGYISNARIVKGQALYTANFTPATSSLTTTSQGAVAANVSLLTCQSTTFVDNSPNAFTITNTGTTLADVFNPYSGATAFLAAQNSTLIDNSAIVKTITAAGDARPAPNGPFLSTTTATLTGTEGSAYFDGTGDMVYSTMSAPAPYTVTGNFTVEAWVYPTAAESTYIFLFGVQRQAYAADLGIGLTKTGGFIYIAGGGGAATQYIAAFPGSVTITSGRWWHIALVRNNGTLTAYLNGAAGTGVAASGTIAPYLQRSDLSGSLGYYLGTNESNWTVNTPTYYAGYVSNLRYVIGTAVYTAPFVPEYTPLTTVANTHILTFQTRGAHNNSAFPDNSTLSSVVTRFGNSTNGTFSPYGSSWSVFMPSAWAFWSYPDSSAHVIGTNDFTVECWVNLISYSAFQSTFLGKWTGAGSRSYLFYVTPTGGLGLAYNSSGILETPTAGLVPLNTWTHVAITRTSGVIYYFVDGTVRYSTAFTTSIGAAGTNITVGVNQEAYTGAPGYQFLGYLSNLRFVNGTGLYTSTFTPSTTPLTAIQNTVLLTCQSNSLADRSTNNFTPTATGSPQVQRFSPFGNGIIPTYYSGYFNGSSSVSLSNTGQSVLNVAAGATFTIEAWVNLSTIASTQIIVADNVPGTANYYWHFAVNTSGYLYFSWYIGSSVLATSTVTVIAVNTWYHVAMSVNAGAISLFVNGVAQAASGTTTLSTPSGNTGTIAIGQASSGPPAYLTGYISNLRITKGQAVYTGTFTPATAPLSTTQSARTNVVAIAGIPANGNSVYFNGSTDYLTLATSPSFSLNTSDFTIEFWMYQTAYGSANQNIVDLRGSAGSPNVNISFYMENGSGTGTKQLRVWDGSADAIVTSSNYPINTWYHVAITRQGTSLRLFINGVQTGSTSTNSTNYTNTAGVYIGAYTGPTAYYYGYISSLRVVKGLAVYTSAFTVPTSPLATTQSSSANVAAISGVPVNGNSVYFNGSTDYLSTAAGLTSLDLTSSDFTAECWVYNTGAGAERYLFSQRGAGSGWEFRINATNLCSFFYTSGSIMTSTGAISGNTWTHLAVSRSGTTVRIFINGTLDSSATFANGTSAAASYGLYIGWTTTGSGGYMSGYISNARITKGQALYTANFTPATSSLTTTSQDARPGTVSLLACQATTFIDSVTGAAITTAGTPKIIRSQSPFGYSPSLLTCQPTRANIIVDNGVDNNSITNAGSVRGSFTVSPFGNSPALLALQNNTFTDSGLDNLALTAVSAPRPAAVSPFTATAGTINTYSPAVFGGSMYFDGTGDYIATTTNATFGTANYTIECWIYHIVNPNPCWIWDGVYSSGPGPEVYFFTSGTVLRLNKGNGGVAAISASVTARLYQWTHYAFCRVGTTVTAYVNGVSVGSGTDDVNYTTSIRGGFGSRARDGAEANQAYFGDFRIVAGTALYTANFFPGTTPMTPTYTIGTSTYNATLLLNGTSAGVVDATRSVDLETVGDAKVVQNSPYNGTYYSLYGTTSAGATITQTTATDLGSGSFTVEGWIYVTGVGSSTGAIITKRASDGALTGSWGLYLNTSYAVIFGGVGWGSTFTTSQTVLLNTWTHVAVTRSSTTLSIFLNGVRTSVAATTDSSNYTCSQYTFIKLWGNLSGTYPSGTAMTDGFLGYLSNLRIVQGSAVYNPAASTITVPTAPLAAVTGTTLLTCQSNRFVDNSTNGLTITPYSTSQIAPQNPFRISTGVSYYFDGTGDTLKVISSPASAFSTGDFTVEGWIYYSSAGANSGTLVDFRSGSTGTNFLIYLGPSATLTFYATGAARITGTTMIPNRWYHIVVARATGNTRMFVDGAQVGSTFADSYNYAQTDIYVGAGYDVASLMLTGYIADLRVTKGYARYTTAFTPPTSNNLLL